MQPICTIQRSLDACIIERRDGLVDGDDGDVGQQLPVIHGASSFAEGHTVILGGDPSELLPLAPEQQGVLPGETGAATTVGEGVHGYG